MFLRSSCTSLLLALLSLPAPLVAQQTSIVDGILGQSDPSLYTTISAAVAASHPGDRILVHGMVDSQGSPVGYTELLGESFPISFDGSTIEADPNTPLVYVYDTQTDVTFFQLHEISQDIQPIPRPPLLEPNSNPPTSERDKGAQQAN